MARQGVEADIVDLSKGLSVEELDRLIGKRDYREFLNPKNELYRQMGMKTNPPPREEALRLMSENPNLIRRPILVRGSRVVAGFSEDEWRKA
jgi:arsenate reductase-like glutaredoxin family protein